MSAPTAGLPIELVHTRISGSAQVPPKASPSDDKKIIKDRIKSLLAEKAPEKNPSKFVAGIVPLMSGLEPEEREIFYDLLEQFVEDHPDYDTTHDAWTLYRTIINEIRLLRIGQYEIESFKQSKASGFLEKPDILVKETESLTKEIARLTSDGHISRHSRDGSHGNIRLTIANIAANLNKDRLGNVQTILIEEERQFKTAQEIQQETLLTIDAVSVGSPEQLMTKLLEVSQKEQVIKDSPIGYAHAESQE